MSTISYSLKGQFYIIADNHRLLGITGEEIVAHSIAYQS